MGRSRLQLTLAILKPDLMMHPVRTKEVKTIIKDNGFLVIQSKVTKFCREDAEKFYEEHRERFFFNRLTGFMTSGPMTAMVLAKENGIAHWRDLMGPTKTYRARALAPTSIRALYGISDTRNATHGSGMPLLPSPTTVCNSNQERLIKPPNRLFSQDSDDSAKKEINFFFPDFDCVTWFETHEALYRENRHRVSWDDEEGIHYLK